MPGPRRDVVIDKFYMQHNETNIITILFICTGNSARSQMAEYLLNLDGARRFQGFSAGTDPKGVNPLTVAAMGELGVSMAGARSKHVAEFENSKIDYVISVCDRAKESCPVWPGGARRIAWSFDDPAAAVGTAEERLAVFRRIRDEIRGRILQFMESGN